jgi:hypothetical protein
VAARPVIHRHHQLIIQINTWLHVTLGRAKEATLAEVNQLVIERAPSQLCVKDTGMH